MGVPPPASRSLERARRGPEREPRARAPARASPPTRGESFLAPAPARHRHAGVLPGRHPRHRSHARHRPRRRHRRRRDGRSTPPGRFRLPMGVGHRRVGRRERRLRHGEFGREQRHLHGDLRRHGERVRRRRRRSGRRRARRRRAWSWASARFPRDGRGATEGTVGGERDGVRGLRGGGHLRRFDGGDDADDPSRARKPHRREHERETRRRERERHGGRSLRRRGR